jgi:8-oxo-dGTP diphosphatase
VPGQPQVAVSALAEHDGTLLLVRRHPDRPGGGLWALPGGRVEPGERLADAVCRELAEETGLRARCGPFVGWVERIGDDGHYVILDFRVDLDSPPGTAVAGDDATALAWVPLAAVAAHDLVPGLADFLADHGVIARPAAGTGAGATGGGA